jgi:UDP-2-acetamido-2-deoxy-ribo-hexuluronate aminotransferase
LIEFIDLMEQYRHVQNEINNNIQTVLNHGKYIIGPEVKELEQKLAEYAGVRHAISCSNGTDALLMALMAWGVGSGDAVFTTPFTFIATAEVVSLLGATPIFVDIDPDTYNIDVKMLEKSIERTVSEGKLNPKAIIPVDLFGLPADYDSIMVIAKKYGLKVLEDAAQSFGSVYKQKKAGSLGDAAATSFFPAKPLGCYGDGGAIFTNDDELAEKLLSIRVHGQGKDKYDNVRIGINGRLDTIQAAILIAKLTVFDEELRARNGIALKYTMGLKKILKTPSAPDGLVSSWAQYSVLAEDNKKRELIREQLKKAGVPTAVYYPVPLHLQQAFRYLGYKEGDFPISEDVSRRIFSIPMHPYLKDEIIEEIIEAIKCCYSQI